ncbi:MAG TPA: SDR family NAD(P)-dependent oxidoreductase, partial [Ornithinibacter sp.]|nr:SDR family NAD(P)-dependent oxidoreductase [Ornithinibacter sp.]
MINYELHGKVAVITGGASGIGLACAHTMARSGADVSIWDLDQSALDDALLGLGRYGHRVHGAVVDVADSARVDAAMQGVVDDLGRVDITVCNAGIGGEANTSGDYSDQGWQQVIGINLNGVFYTQRAAIRAMKATGGGSIINMASILGQVGFA